MNLHDPTCARTRELLSARLDGLDPGDSGPSLARHLATCDACRAHEQDLARLRAAFSELRAAPPVATDLWADIERRAGLRRNARPRLLRLAAAAAGFLGVAGGARWLESRPAEPALQAHLLERLQPSNDLDQALARLPEYRLLRVLPTLDVEERR